MKRVFVGMIFLLIFCLANGRLAFATGYPCGCYCGKYLPEPCSDQACKDACGWHDPAASSAGSGSSYSAPAYDYAAERQRDEAQRQRAAQEQREQQRQLMTPEERNAADIQAIAAQVNFQRDMDAFYRNDASDKAQYDAKVHAGDKVYKRHQKAVEAELKRCRDRGFNVPREELLYREIGKEALNVAEQSTRSTATRRKPVSKPSNSRGDATSTPGKRGPSSDKEALRKRLENMPL